MSSTQTNNKCPKCEKVRFKDIPRSSFFALSNEETVNIANRFKPEIKMKLYDNICINSYRKAKRINGTSIASEKETRINVFELNISSNHEITIRNEFHASPVTETNTNTEIENTNRNNISVKVDKMVQTDFNTVSEFILVDLPKSYSSHKRCIVCFKNNSYKKLHLVPDEARVQAMIEKSIFIPNQCRTCLTHLQDKRFKMEEKELIVPIKRQVKMDSESINDLIDSLIEASKKNKLFDDFADLETLDDGTCKETTGFFKKEFELINGHLSGMKDSAIRTKSQALAIYLFWLKTGLNQETIEAHFNINDKGIYDTFGDQTELIDKHLQSQQLYMCSANCFCGRNHDYGGEMISFVKQGLETSISIKKHQCNSCKKLIEVKTQFLSQNKNPPFLIVNNSLNLEIFGNELENEIEINGYNYVLLFYTIFKVNHYLGVYSISKRLYLFDDLSPLSYKPINQNLKITSAFYLRKN